MPSTNHMQPGCAALLRLHDHPSPNAHDELHACALVLAPPGIFSGHDKTVCAQLGPYAGLPCGCWCWMCATALWMCASHTDAHGCDTLTASMQPKPQPAAPKSGWGSRFLVPNVCASYPTYRFVFNPGEHAHSDSHSAGTVCVPRALPV